MERPKIIFNSIDRDSEYKHLLGVKSELDSFKLDFLKNNSLIRSDIGELRWLDYEQKIDSLKSIRDLRYNLDRKHNAVITIDGSPYFARLDFENDDDRSVIYISKGDIKSALSDYDNVKYVNWRSPIASLLYKYNYSAIKNAQFNTDTSVKSGDIHLVAKIKIKDWSLEDISSSSISQDGDLDQFKLRSAVNQDLQNKLAERSTDKMSEIVDTIQADQYEIIRQDVNSNLIVQGCAGSGKTAVALHRIAYLLYNGLDSREILFISPNNNFSNYISNVLPELGETNIIIKTLDEICRSVFSERLLPRSFDSVIENYLRLREKDQRINIFFEADDDLDKIVKEHIDSARRRRLVVDKYFESLSEIKQSRYMDVENSKLLLTRSDLVWNSNSKSATGNNFELKIGESVDFTFYAIVEAIIKKLTYPKIPKNNVTKKVTSHIKTIKHIIVDEAQDYTKWQIYLLHLLCPEATFTILGDRFQTSNPYARVYDRHIGEQDKNDFSLLLNEVNREKGSQSKYFESKSAYRSSPEIVRYCNNILGTDIVPIRDSQGVEVEERRPENYEKFLNQIKRDIDQLIVDGVSRIGVVTNNSKQVFLLFDELEVYSNNEKINFYVMPFYEAKGLEFDAVIVVHGFAFTRSEESRASKLGREVGIANRMLYIACTRAQHKLIVYYYDIEGALALT